MSRIEAGEPPEKLKRSGLTPAVIDASFTVEEGEIFVVMGLSGSGKSTLIRMINGLHEPTSGHVEVYGENLTAASSRKLRRLRRERISMVFQHFALFPHRTVLDNAAYGLETKGLSRAKRRARAHDALELCGLTGWDDSLPSQLSGGMQQRVGLARALAADTDILLMDEAFSALDPLIRREMQDQLIELQHKLGKTILFITHDLNEAMRLGDRIAMMRNGRIVQIGTAEEILTDPANDYVAQFVADVDRTRVLTASSIMEPPVAVLGGEQGPRAAHKLMREHQQPGLYVVTRDRQLRGYVTERDVSLRLQETNLEQMLHPIETTVRADDPVASLFTPSAETNLPLPVLDENDRLIGVIPRVTLLSALGQHADAPIVSDHEPAPPDAAVEDSTTPPDKILTAEEAAHD
ncbi:MAG: glycine betaine/L-proline ABC transporter ATP-binding protein [Nocardioides sp.]